eukprot:Rhum_TRINITY_DN13642_c0_g1::Rhum_TRINITY_DN13642_c0_g1_i2::g.62327::m.62327
MPSEHTGRVGCAACAATRRERVIPDYKRDYACAAVMRVEGEWQVLLAEPKRSSAFVRVLYLCAGEPPSYGTEIEKKVTQLWDSEAAVLRDALCDPAHLQALMQKHVGSAVMGGMQRPGRGFRDQLTRLLNSKEAASQSHPKWRLPGGKPEAGEEGWDTAVREFEEETGVPRQWLERVPGGEFSLGFTTIFVTQIVNAEAREPVVGLDVGECTGHVRFMRSVPKTSILAEKLARLWCNLSQCSAAAPALAVDPRLAKEKWTAGSVVEAEGCLVLTARE